MSKRSKRDVDYNLLAVFDAIMMEGSLRGAAARLGMAEAAVSQSLARLRRAVGDNLFERRGRGVQPTARAQEMAERVRPAMDLMRAAFTGLHDFEPHSVRRTFKLDVPAGIDTLMAAALAARLDQAPGLNFQIANARATSLAKELRYGGSQIALDYEPLAETSYRSELIFEDDFVVIARADHPELQDGLGIVKFQRLGHVAVSWGGDQRASPLVQKLTAATIARNIRISVPSLPSMLRVVSGSDLVGATWSRAAARALNDFPGLKAHPLPFEMPPVPIYMVWHDSYDADAGHTWLRDCLRDIYRAI